VTQSSQPFTILSLSMRNLCLSNSESPQLAIMPTICLFSVDSGQHEKKTQVVRINHVFLREIGKNFRKYRFTFTETSDTQALPESIVLPPL